MLSECEVCGGIGVHRCKICGRIVCDRDYDARRGICSVCSETLCRLCGEYLAVGYCKVCGRLVCRLCSVEVGVELVCKECWKRISNAQKKEHT